MNDIAALVSTINRIWLENNVEASAATLADVFHDDMVIAGKDFTTLARGRDASVAHYVDFARAATVHAFSTTDPQIEVSGRTAVATYVWTIEYEKDGARHVDTGSDVFVFARKTATWRAVWRAILPVA